MRISILPHVRITRLEDSDTYGVFGVMTIDGQVFCVTLEPPEMENMRNESCIPDGQYTCSRVVSPRYGDTFEVTNVPGRSHVLFHAGNVRSHTRGCILLGEHFGKLRGDKAVLNSGKTFESFISIMDGWADFNLTITKGY